MSTIIEALGCAAWSTGIVALAFDAAWSWGCWGFSFFTFFVFVVSAGSFLAAALALGGGSGGGGTPKRVICFWLEAGCMLVWADHLQSYS